MIISRPSRTKLRHSKLRLCFSEGEVKEKNAFIEQLNNNDNNNNNNNNNSSNDSNDNNKNNRNNINNSNNYDNILHKTSSSPPNIS